MLSPGEQAGSRCFMPLLDQISLPGSKGRPRKRCRRLFSWLKKKRRLCTRYDKLPTSFKAMITLACIEKCLRADFSDKP